VTDEVRNLQTGDRMKQLEQVPSGVTLAPIVEALHEVYNSLSAETLKNCGQALPPAVFVVQRSSTAWGHITVRPAWQTDYTDIDEDYAYAPFAVSMGLGNSSKSAYFHEIMVSGECLAKGGRAVFGTVAHEATHAFNIVAGVRDVDTNGRHNTKFRDSAGALFGLTIEEYSKGHWAGWTKTTVGKPCANRWAREIAKLDEAIITASGQEKRAGGLGIGGGIFGGDDSRPTGRDKNGLKAVCRCGSIIRTSRRALDKGITCGGCESPFIVVGG